MRWPEGRLRRVSAGEEAEMTRILIVDDEPHLVALLNNYLSREGYDIVTAGDGATALDMTRALDPDLILLDVMLPGMDGVEVCREIRRFSDAYILMLTARAEEVDKLIGLSVGADDDDTKPFSPREGVARGKARLRRPRARGQRSEAATTPAAPPLRIGTLVIDEDGHTVTRDGAEVALTAREFALLATLARHPGRVFTRAQLLEQVWGDEYYDDHVVDVHIGNLRKKLETDVARPHYIATVRGVGYRMTAGSE